MKKFLLVPPQQVPQPLTKKLTQLDEEMKTILERTDISDYEKAHAYSEVLEKYLDVKNKLTVPHNVPLISESRNPTQNTKVLPKKEIKQDIDMGLFQRNYRARAQHLLQHMDTNSNIAWNNRYEMLINGETIPGTNIVDLVDDIIRTQWKDKPRPAGSDVFVEKLQDSNIPHMLIGNKDRFYNNNAEIDQLKTPTPKRKTRAQLGRGRVVNTGIKKWENL